MEKPIGKPWNVQVKSLSSRNWRKILGSYFKCSSIETIDSSLGRVNPSDQRVTLWIVGIPWHPSGMICFVLSHEALGKHLQGESQVIVSHFFWCLVTNTNQLSKPGKQSLFYWEL